MILYYFRGRFKMATLMEKDVLMELATGAIALMRKDRSEQADSDRKKAQTLHRSILFEDHNFINYKEYLKNIQTLRKKYEGLRVDTKSNQWGMERFN